MDDQLIFFGLNGSTGDYLVQLSAHEAAARAQQEPLNNAHLRDIQARVQSQAPDWGIVRTAGDPSNLASAGWGVIFSADAGDDVREALTPLLDYRREQASTFSAVRYQEYRAKRGYHSGETTREFLKNRGVFDSGPADPDQMPYYLLIVGDPEIIPYSFQYQLDVQYAVGRIYFDTLDEYAQYAQSVVAAEKTNPRPLRAAFFGVENEGDRPTQLSMKYLAQPLIRDAHTWQAKLKSGQRVWTVAEILRADATKARLGGLMGGDETPMLLFTASHGVGFPNGHPLQLRHQGALVCQDWPGPIAGTQGPLQNYYLSADDIADEARLLGMVAFHFACFGAGTPGEDDYPQLINGQVKPSGPLGTGSSLPLAPHSFVARLPQRLLGHPKGGALAVVGHVERALGSSFVEQPGVDQPLSPTTFRGALYQIMEGKRLGAAIEPFNERYAELGAAVADEVHQIEAFGRDVEEVALAKKWMAAADARGYAIFGDPAVRLAVEAEPPSTGAETIIPRVDVPPIANPDEAPPPDRPAYDAPEEGSAAHVPVEPRAASKPAAPPAPPASAVPGVRLEIDPTSGRIVVTTSGPTGASDSLTAYGLPFASGGSALASVGTRLADALSELAKRLGTALGDLVSDVSSLEVATCTAENLDDVDYDALKGEFVHGRVRRRAVTYIRLDGHTVAVLPEADGEVDRELWALHTDMVERAAAQRAELIKSMLEALGGLLGATKGDGK